MSFHLSPELDGHKVFLTNFSEIESRFDCSYYKPEFREFYRRFEQVENALEPIFRNAKVICGPFGSSITTKDYTNKGIPLIRISNIDSDGKLSDKGIVYISEQLASDLASYKVYKNDIIVSQRGSLGMVSVVPENLSGAVISANLIAIKNLSSMTPEYLQTIISTTIGQRQIQRKTSGQVQTKITTDDIKALLVPLFDSSKQTQIVSKMANAYAAKKQKEAEARRLLDNIDDYLLGELGIELPEQKENTIQNRIFTRQLSEVSGGRFDSNFYKPYYTNITDTIKAISHDKLGHIVKFSSESWDQKSIFTNTFPYIEIGEIDLSFGEIKSISQINIDEAPSRAKMIVRNGDIIISTTRPSRGAIVKIDDGIDDVFIASTGFSIVREITKPDINPLYLYYILRQSISLKQMEQRSSGGNYPAITQEELSQIIVPIPGLRKQTEIANHITNIRNQAKSLQQQAKADLEQAKKEVESMILGEDASMA